MSKTVDERVVSMQFDNKNFEKNVQTSMSTLDKLKQSLNLSGASKGLGNVEAAARRCDLTPLGKAVESVKLKFSALEVMAVTALSNITNSAVNAGKRMVAALTIDPVKMGFQEYETQINAVQTILSNTRSKGTTLDDVNQALDTLNTYADKTIYNFTEMTRNIGTFTAAGIDLETSVNAIQGIANLAAVSGSTSQQASTAMYQLSQALASGTVKLMDWNSVVNAGMGGQVFQDALKETARVHGIAIDSIIEKQGSFRESLSEGWLTSEILTETLQKFTLTTEGLTEAQIEQNRAMLRAKGYTEQQIDAIFALGEDATNAATKVKTFTQLLDTLKESAQSGWTQTWEILVGDFEEAKTLWTSISETVGGMINRMSERRNNFLFEGMTSNFGKLTKKLNEAGIGSEQLTESLREVFNRHGFKSIDEYIKKYGSLEKAFQSGAINSKWLKEAIDNLSGSMADLDGVQSGLKKGNKGDDVKKIQKALKDLGYDLGEFGEQADGLDGIIGDVTEQAIKDFQKVSGLEVTGIIDDATLEALRKSGKEFEGLGDSIDDLINNVDKLGGRQMLIESFAHIWKELKKPFEAVGKAWRDVFGQLDPKLLYNAIEAFHKFTMGLSINGDTIENITRTFKGLFALLDIVTTFLGGGVKIAFKALSKVLGAFGLNILDVTANLGDMLVNFRDFLFNNDYVNKSFEFLANGAKFLAEKIKELWDLFRNIPQVQQFFENIKNIDLKEVGRNIIEGLKNGLNEGISSLPEKLIEIGNLIINTIEKILGISSPSKVMIAIGGFIVAGLIIGITKMFPDVGAALEEKFSGVIEFVKSINWGSIFSGLMSVGLLIVAKKFADAFGNLAEGVGGLGEMFAGVGVVLRNSAKGIGKILKNFGKVLGSIAFSIKAKALKNIAISIAILAASIIALSFIEPAKLWNAVGVIAALSAVLIGLAFAVSKMSDSSMAIGKDGLKVDNLKQSLLGIAAAILLLGITVKLIGSMNPEEAKQGFLGLAGIMAALLIVLGVYGKLVKGKSAQNADKAGVMLFKMAGAILILTIVAKMISKMSWGDMAKAGAGLLGFVGIIALLILITKMAGKNINKVGPTLLKISAAILILTIVAKSIARMSWGDMAKAGAGLLGLVGIITLLMLITMIPGKNLDTVGRTLLSISGAILALTIVAKMISKMTWADMGKAAAGLLGLVGVIALLVLITKLAGNDAPKIATTLLALSGAIAILALVAILLGFIDIASLAKGVIAVTILGGIMAGMILATSTISSKKAKHVKGILIAMTAAIGVMALAIIALSFIDPSRIAVATGAMATVMGMFALMIKASEKVSKSFGALIVMTVAIGLIGTALYILAGLPVESTLGAAGALSTVLLSMAGAMAIIGKFGGMSSKAIGSVIIMTVIIAALAGILYLLRDMSIESSLSAAAGLTLLLIALTGSMLALKFIGGVSPMALVTVGVMTLVMAALAGILYLLRDLPVESTMGIAKSLSLLLLSLSAACLILTVVGLGGPAALIGVLSLSALIIAIGGLMYAIGKLCDSIPKMEEFLDKGIVILEKIGYGLGSFFGNIISGFSNAVMETLPKLGQCLSQFMENAMPFVNGIKLVDASMLEGVGVLAAAVLLLTAADLVAGIASFLQGGASFADLGLELSKFMISALPFIALANTINSKAMEGVKCLAETILILTAADILEGVTSWLTGGSSLADFGAQLVPFGEAIAEFSSAVSGKIDAEAITAAADAGKALAEMQDCIPKSGGWWQEVAGESDMVEFSASLVAFGACIVAFSKSVSAEGALNKDKILEAADAGTALADMQGCIPKSGGWWQEVVGKSDMIEFSDSLVAFGECITAFSKSVSAEGAINKDKILEAADAGTALADLEKSIPKSGGWWQEIAGESDIESFGGKIKAFGECLVDFSKSVSEEGAIDKTAIQNAADSATLMVDVANAIPSKTIFDGKVEIDDFGSKVKSFGEKLVEYSESVSEIDDAKVSGSIGIANRLVTLVKKVTDLDLSGIKDFKISNLGDKLKGYSDSVSKADFGKVDSSITAANKLAKFIKSTAGIDTTGVDKFKSAIDGLAEVDFGSMAEKFSSSAFSMANVGMSIVESITKGINSKKSDLIAAITSLISSASTGVISGAVKFASIGKTLVAGIGTGITNSKAKVKLSIKSLLSTMVSAIRTYYSSFRSSGSYLVSGFCKGIEENTYRVKARARIMAREAANAARRELQERSPSKVFYKIGAFAGDGFVNALADYGRTSYKAGSQLASEAKAGLSRAISKVTDVINSDMDTQPTIRPVLDLSDVSSGVGAINGMFGMTPSIGVMSNIGAISSMMNGRQNGGNDDVISAIKDLGSKIGNTSGNTYTINGVNYSDDTEVANAFKTIIRAAKVERRA